MKLKSVCIFCGARPGAKSLYSAHAEMVAALLAQRGIQIVFGGGRAGLMGVVADSAIQLRGQVVGVIPRSLKELEMAHNGVSHLHVVETMHERKALMADLSDAFIALPGGFGTLDELCEIVTWMQLGFHQKPIAILNTENYFDPFIQFVDSAVGQGFISFEHRSRLIVDSDPEKLINKMLAI